MHVTAIFFADYLYSLLDLVTWRVDVYLGDLMFLFSFFGYIFGLMYVKFSIFRSTDFLILARHSWWCILFFFGQFLLGFLGSPEERSRCFRNPVFILIICDSWKIPGECCWYYLRNHSSMPCKFKNFFCSPVNSTGSGFWSTSHSIQKAGYFLGNEAECLWNHPLILQYQGKE